MWVKAGIGGENSERGRGKSGGREGRETQEERGDGDERERMRESQRYRSDAKCIWLG